MACYSHHCYISRNFGRILAESIGVKVNPYDPCVANRIVNGKQHTVTLHVDFLKSRHVDSKVNAQFLEWLKTKYASDEIGEVKVMRGKKHDYLAMTLPVD